jgi:hypothetical protein
VKVENEIIEIHPLWRGHLPQNASYAALGCDIYRFGGDCSSSSVSSTEVYKLVSNFPISDESWIQMPSMKVPRIRARILVLDGKIYAVGGTTFFLTRSDPRWHEIQHLGVGRDAKQHVGIFARKFEALSSFVEVFDPTIGEWKVLPPLPIHSPFESKYTCAALENPNRILIASLSRTGRALVLCQYYVQQDCWKRLNKLIIDRPLGKKKPVTHADIRYWLTIESTLGKKAVTAGDTLYWLTGDSKLVAYDVVQDVWLSGQLKGVGITFLEYDEPLPHPKCSLIHLEGERFAMVQRDSYTDVEVECVIIEVYRQPRNKRFGLGISLVSLHTYKTQSGSFVSDCFLL